MDTEEAMKKKGPRKELRDIDRAVIQAVMFENGIIPMENTLIDMRRPLKQLPPAEARAAKRKFRKLWRKAAKATVGNGKTRSVKEEAQNRELGVGKHVPSRAERNARKQLVFDQMWNNTIGPIIENFENVIDQSTKPKGNTK